MNMFEIIKDQVGDAKKIIFVTGAGISQESGIPTFRGKDGLKSLWSTGQSRDK